MQQILLCGLNLRTLSHSQATPWTLVTDKSLLHV